MMYSPGDSDNDVFKDVIDGGDDDDKGGHNDGVLHCFSIILFMNISNISCFLPNRIK